MNSFYKLILKILPIIYYLHIFSLLTSTGGMETFTWTGIVLVTFIVVYEYVVNKNIIFKNILINKVALILFIILLFSTITSPYLKETSVTRFFYFSRSKSLLYLIYHIVILTNFVNYKKIIPKLKYIVPIVMLYGLFRATTNIDIFRGVFDYKLSFDFPKGVRGFFNNYLAFSNVFQIYVLIIISFFINIKNERKNIWTISSVVLGIICLMLSGSRMLFISLFMGILAQGILTRKRVYIWLIIISLLAPSIAVTTSTNLNKRVTRMFSKKSDYTYGDACRYYIWKSHIEIFKHNPIKGAGYGVNERLHEKYLSRKAPRRCRKFSHAHNMYLNVLSGSGILGFIAFMMFWIIIFKYAIDNYIYAIRKQEKFDTALSIGLFGSLIAFLTAGLTECIFTHLMIIHSGIFMSALIVFMKIKSKENS